MVIETKKGKLKLAKITLSYTIINETTNKNLICEEEQIDVDLAKMPGASKDILKALLEQTSYNIKLVIKADAVVWKKDLVKEFVLKKIIKQGK